MIKLDMTISESAFGFGQDDRKRKCRFHGGPRAVSHECERMPRAFGARNVGVGIECGVNAPGVCEGAAIAIAGFGLGRIEFVSSAKLVAVFDKLERLHPCCGLDEAECSTNGEQAGSYMYELFGTAQDCKYVALEVGGACAVLGCWDDDVNPCVVFEGYAAILEAGSNLSRDVSRMRPRLRDSIWVDGARQRAASDGLTIAGVKHEIGGLV